MKFGRMQIFLENNFNEKKSVISQNCKFLRKNLTQFQTLFIYDMMQKLILFQTDFHICPSR